MSFIDSDSFTFIVLPLLIFLARIADVSIGTIRIVFLSKGKKSIPAILGFFEVLIWVTVIGKIMQNIDNVACYIAYAGGFAVGNYVGLFIEEKLAMGIVGIRIITKVEASELCKMLKEEGYGITIIPAEGMMGKVNIIYSTINRKEIEKFAGLINKYNPNAFYTIEEVKSVSKGIFHSMKGHRDIGAIKNLRKSK